MHIDIITDNRYNFAKGRWILWQLIVLSKAIIYQNTVCQKTAAFRIWRLMIFVPVKQILQIATLKQYINCQTELTDLGFDYIITLCDALYENLYYYENEYGKFRIDLEIEMI